MNVSGEIKVSDFQYVFIANKDVPSRQVPVYTLLTS